MKAAGLLILLGIVVALLFWFPSNEETEQPNIDSMQRQAAIIDARIALAGSQTECIAMVNGEYGKAATESLNYVGLKPDYQRVLQEGSGDQPETPSDNQRDDLRAEFDSMGHAGLVLLMCLRHLDDKGIVPLGESVPAVAERLSQLSEQDG